MWSRPHGKFGPDCRMLVTGWMVLLGGGRVGSRGRQEWWSVPGTLHPSLVSVLQAAAGRPAFRTCCPAPGVGLGAGCAHRAPAMGREPARCSGAVMRGDQLFHKKLQQAICFPSNWKSAWVNSCRGGQGQARHHPTFPKQSPVNTLGGQQGLAADGVQAVIKLLSTLLPVGFYRTCNLWPLLIEKSMIQQVGM